MVQMVSEAMVIMVSFFGHDAAENPGKVYRPETWVTDVWRHG